MRPMALLALMGAALAGCVYYPSGYGYGYGYSSGYYAAPSVVVQPAPVVIGGWWGWGGDDDHGWGH
ncbi:hypothetical protein [Acidocella aminolytica]|jgi:hypothetical protein|uniref:hypothetical protein n=2 Tax=Acidocella aminolytica TaxID=33998 RepID=UPI000932AAE9|nr:hypothetical protein [Acidocella aminolytica]